MRITNANLFNLWSAPALLAACVLAGGCASLGGAARGGPGEMAMLLQDAGAVAEEEVEMERRLDIKRMQGEAERLAASSEELRARAANCAARREARASGAAVQLCSGDVEEGDAVSTLAHALSFLRDLELRLNELERRWAEGERP